MVTFTTIETNEPIKILIRIHSPLNAKIIHLHINKPYSPFTYELTHTYIKYTGITMHRIIPLGAKDYP